MHGPKMPQDSDRSWQFTYVADSARALAQSSHNERSGSLSRSRWMLLRRLVSDNVEFMFVSFWDSMDVLAEYTGGSPEQPKYYPEDRAALLQLPEGVEHYQLVDLQARW